MSTLDASNTRHIVQGFSPVAGIHFMSTLRERNTTDSSMFQSRCRDSLHVNPEHRQGAIGYEVFGLPFWHTADAYLWKCIAPIRSSQTDLKSKRIDFSDGYGLWVQTPLEVLSTLELTVCQEIGSDEPIIKLVPAFVELISKP